MSNDIIRPADAKDRDAIIYIWHQGWHDAHHDLVPQSILPYRKREHFLTWFEECQESTIVALVSENLVGFYSTEESEISKLYVQREARGTGIAGKLLSHAENQLRSQGIDTANIHCTAGNTRAQNFYEHHGWDKIKTFEDGLWHPDGKAGCVVLTHYYTKNIA